MQDCFVVQSNQSSAVHCGNDYLGNSSYLFFRAGTVLGSSLPLIALLKNVMRNASNTCRYLEIDRPIIGFQCPVNREGHVRVINSWSVATCSDGYIV